MKETGGTGLVTLLAVLFIALKLTGYIDWSWLWVLAPIWIPILAGLVFAIGFAIFILIMAILGKPKNKKYS